MTNIYCAQVFIKSEITANLSDKETKRHIYKQKGQNFDAPLNIRATLPEVLFDKKLQ